jgi:hypothetical protein
MVNWNDCYKSNKRGCVYLRPQKMLRKDNRLGEDGIYNLQKTLVKRTTGLGETLAILFRFYKLFRSCSHADPKDQSGDKNLYDNNQPSITILKILGLGVECILQPTEDGLGKG